MEFEVFDLGLTGFEEALRFQKELFSRVKAGALNGALVLCSHHPVITTGRRAKAGAILVSDIELERRGIPVYQTERGGEVTYHGPGQLTLYPVINLGRLKKDIRYFLRELEGSAIDMLSELGIKGSRRGRLTGVWVEGRKVASIGIAVRNWITFHGMSINIKKDDLSNFRFIRPCGMDIRMTSVETVSGRSIDMAQVGAMLTDGLKKRFSTVN